MKKSFLPLIVITSLFSFESNASPMTGACEFVERTDLFTSSDSSYVICETHEYTSSSAIIIEKNGRVVVGSSEFLEGAPLKIKATFGGEVVYMLTATPSITSNAGGIYEKHNGIFLYAMLKSKKLELIIFREEIGSAKYQLHLDGLDEAVKLLGVKSPNNKELIIGYKDQIEKLTKRIKRTNQNEKKIFRRSINYMKSEIKRLK